MAAYRQYKAIISLDVACELMNASITTATDVPTDLFIEYVCTVTQWRLGWVGGYSPESNEGKKLSHSAKSHGEFAKRVAGLFGDRLPAELPLPRGGEGASWLSAAMWQYVG